MRKIFATAMLFLFLNNSFAQIGIGTNSPSSKLEVVGSGTTSATSALKVGNATHTILSVRNDGLVEVSTTNQGFLIPRMTSAQRDAIIAPIPGMIIFNTTNSRFEGCISSSVNTLSNSTLAATGAYVQVNDYPAQTFQVSSNTSNCEISFWVHQFFNSFATGDVTFELRTGTPGSQSSALLYSQNLTINSLGEKIVSISNITLSAATTYHFLIKPISAYAAGWFSVSRSGGNPPGDYAGGSLFYFMSNSWGDSQNDDLKFQIRTSIWTNLH